MWCTRSPGGLRLSSFPEPDSREPWFMSQAHAEADIVDRVVSAFEVSLAEALDERMGAVGGQRIAAL